MGAVTIAFNRPIPHYYTCTLLLRIDALLYELRGKPMYWSSDGALCERMPKGHGVEARSHFPGWMFRAACYVQNRWLWTRRLLDWGTSHP